LASCQVDFIGIFFPSFSFSFFRLALRTLVGVLCCAVHVIVVVGEVVGKII